MKKLTIRKDGFDIDDNYFRPKSDKFDQPKGNFLFVVRVLFWVVAIGIVVLFCIYY
jgi:hypothetical protein